MHADNRIGLPTIRSLRRGRVVEKPARLDAVRRLVSGFSPKPSASLPYWLGMMPTRPTLKCILTFMYSILRAERMEESASGLGMER